MSFATGGGSLVTFYSWKGGVGRTLALANTAVQLARRGRRVLMVDWDELVRREGPVVWRTIYRLVHNQADADECMQETFVAAVKYSHHQPVGNWQAMPKRLAVARAVDLSLIHL